jgi:iron complex outermembrane recepter protein
MLYKNVKIPMLSMVVLLPFSLSAIAQEVKQARADADKETAGIEVIQVTAQKRVESLQETAIAISAFSRTMLEDRDIEDALDIQYSIPNAMVAGNSSFNIRGVGNNAVSSTSDPGTGIHINGVYLSATTPQNEYYDLDAIEVLRGPQGTLYGRNTTAGVVNIITHKPDDIFEASLTAEFASFNSLRTIGVVNFPISDNVQQRFAFNTVKRDGYTENVAENVDFDRLDGRDQYSVRSSTAMQFSDKAEGLLFIEYFKEDSDRSGQVGVLCKSDPILGCNPNILASEYPNSDFTDGSLANGGLAGLLGFIGYDRRADFYNTNLDGSPKTNPLDPRKVRIDYKPRAEADDLLVSFEFNYDFGEHTFTSVSAYHETNSDTSSDFDNADGSDAFAAPVAQLLPEGRTADTTRHSMAQSYVGGSKQWSQELRVASYLPGPFNYTVGAFYLDYQSDLRVDFYVPELTAVADYLHLNDDFAAFTFDTPEFNTKSWAIFGESYYNFNDDLKLTLGLRYTEEDKDVVTRQISPIDFLLNPAFDEPNSYKDGEGSWEEFTGKIGLSYSPDLDITDNTLFFGTLSRGYKGGGINPGASDTSFPTYDPEYINSFEIGTKNTLLGNTFQANITAFIYQYDGLQVGGILPDSTTFNTNVDADVKGAEFEFIAAPIDGLRVNLNYSILNTEINEDFLTSPDIAYSASVGPVNLKGKELPYAPDSSIQFGIQYTHMLTDNWEITYRAQTYWQDRYWARLYNIPTDRLESWQQTDLNISIKDLDDVWEFEAFVKNASDEASMTSLSVEGALIGRYRKPNYLEPRIVGLRVHYRFE